ncbi:MAG TPA: hypothetical protein VJU61_29040, partial [Polyangiaceae bacterium]|nr:hypothetical protein [Polyangiaceae bacterium]
MPRPHRAWFLLLLAACGTDREVLQSDRALGGPGADTPADAAQGMAPTAGSSIDPATSPGENTGTQPEQFAAPEMQAGAGRDAGRQEGADAGPSEPPADAGLVCPARGSVTYTLARAAAPTPDEEAAYLRIDAAMDRALAFYNCYTNIELNVRVSYAPGVPTADGNVNGSLRFGATNTMNPITAMHELGHVAGVGGPRF